MHDLIAPLLSPIAMPVVLELGGHHGEDAAKILDYAPRARYHLFEPDPRCLAILEANGTAQRVRVVPAAVGAEDGTTLLYQSSGVCVDRPEVSDWDFSSSIKQPVKHLQRLPWCKFNHTVQVPVRSLDSYCREACICAVDFIWSDIQGAEREMIAGGLDTLRNTRWLQSEVDDEEVYEGQLSLPAMLELLPGQWRVVATRRENVLLENLSC